MRVLLEVTNDPGYQWFLDVILVSDSAMIFFVDEDFMSYLTHHRWTELPLSKSKSAAGIRECLVGNRIWLLILPRPSSLVASTQFKIIILLD